MITKKMKAISMLAIVLLFVQSFGNTIALGNYIQKNELSYPTTNTTSNTCGVAGVALIVGVVGVGVTLVQGAYQLGYFLGTMISSNTGEQTFQGLHQTMYDPNDFSDRNLLYHES